ncbi:uncharacterized protein LOC144448334 [Glandiceps talaboti]
MDRHKENLKRVCRLCKVPRAILSDRQPTCKMSYSSIILKGLQVDVTNEDSSIYPPYVCKACCMKLTRWHDKKKRRVTKNMLTIHPQVFEEHTLNCSVCSMVEELHGTSFIRTSTCSILESVSSLGKEYGYLNIHECDSVICLKTSNDGRLLTERIQVHKDGTWSLEVHGRRVTTGPAIASVPVILSNQSCSILFKMLAESSTCPGNEGFETLCRVKTASPLQPAVFYNNQGVLEAYEENCITSTTVRHTKCEMLTTGRRCSVCYAYRSNLSAMKSRHENRSNANPNKTRNDRLSRQELEEKAKNLQGEKKKLKRKLTTTEDMMREAKERKGEVLEDDLSASY